MDGSYQLHLVSGIVGNQGEDNRSFYSSGDKNRVAFRTAKGRLLRSDFDSFIGLEGFKSPKVPGIGDLQIESSRKRVYGEFAKELLLDPWNLRKICGNPDAVDDFSSNFNRRLLSFSKRFSVFCFPSD
jgi:hypothetical protein